MSSYSSPKVSLGSFASFSGLKEKAPQNSSTRRGRLSEADESIRRTPMGKIEQAPIICFCHLSWDWVWQRPQQFLSRFSKQHPILFVETFCSDTPTTSVRLRSAVGFPNVTIAEIFLPQARWGDGDFIDRERRYAIQSLVDDELRGRFNNPILWFYDPMAVTAFAGHLNERLVVYDCMDELSQFKGAPAELLAREEELLAQADVVFCGGRKMREKRLPLNPNSHFYGTGVDIAHFGKARSKEHPIAPELAGLKGPILGYFGVIDERIDYTLIEKLADARSDWNIVMVGPTAKVDHKDFPQRSNIHWVGGRSYDQLPALTKAFSVCLMPFAINAATEYINPTKALEYMAAGRPIVSTAINEVKSNFSSVARVANTREDFVTWCIREVEAPSKSRISAGLKMSVENTWEAICQKMEKHISEAAAEGEAQQETRTMERSAPANSVPTGLAYV